MKKAVKKIDYNVYKLSWKQWLQYIAAVSYTHLDVYKRQVQYPCESQIHTRDNKAFHTPNKE